MACTKRVSALARDSFKLLPRQHTRCLSLHESFSQRLLEEHNVPILKGKVVWSPREAREAAESLGPWVTVKPRLRDENITRIQYETDLREGLKRNNDPAAVEGIAESMIGWKARTPQEDGSYREHVIRSLYVSEMPTKGQPTWHLTLEVDRESFCPILVLQEVLSGKTHQFPVKYSLGIMGQTRPAIAEIVGLDGDEDEALDYILQTMYQIFLQKDMTNIKVKLGRHEDKGKRMLVCQTSRMTVDDAAVKRQPDLFNLRDWKEEDPGQEEAEKSGLVYVKMDGNIGNVVNGAGLAMATNDAIDYYGGKSANFLDAGGQATQETMVKAFDIVLRDPRVRAVIVNVYGGITNCAMIADSIAAAAVQLGPIEVPIVVRLQGTNSATGLKILEEANLGLHVEADFGAAAAKVVELAGPYERQQDPAFGKKPRPKDQRLKI